MARAIASIPFWVLSALFLLAATLWLFDRKIPHEQSAKAAFWGLLISGVFACVAALVMG